MKTIKAVVWAWMILGLAPPVAALSIRSPGKTIVVEGLRAGRSYALAQKARDPAITNTGQEPIRARVEMKRPRKSKLEDGYEPIPSLSWIKLRHLRWKLKPGETADLGGEIHVPKSAKWAAGQYQVEWLGQVDNMKGSTLNFSTRLLLNVDGSAEVLPQESPQARLPTGSEFSLSPPEANARDVSLGKIESLKGQGVSLKLVNPNDVEATFVLRVERHKPRKLRIRQGFTLAPNPYFLRLRRSVMRVGGNRVGIEELSVDIPNEGRYRNRRWVFVISAKIANAPDSGKKYWLVYVSTNREVKK